MRRTVPTIAVSVAAIAALVGCGRRSGSDRTTTAGEPKANPTLVDRLTSGSWETPFSPSTYSIDQFVFEADGTYTAEVSTRMPPPLETGHWTLTTATDGQGAAHLRLTPRSSRSGSDGEDVIVRFVAATGTLDVKGGRFGHGTVLHHAAFRNAS